MTRRAVIIGGVVTSKRMLEPVEQAFGELVGDATTFTFTEAMDNPDVVSRAVDGQVVITHSAGLLAVARHMNPERIFACNGPVQSSVGALAMAALTKTAHHYRDLFKGPDRGVFARAIAGNAADLAAHPYANLRHRRSIAETSTYNYLADARSAGILVGAATTYDDEFFQYRSSLNPGKVPVVQLDGGHDEVLIRPKPFVGVLESQMA